MDTPSFIEDHISQIPALQLLMKMGYQYLTPEEALEARGGRQSNVLLEKILKEQLKKINKIEYKKKEFAFSDANINNALLAIRELPVQDGFLAASAALYDLITLGKSFEQTVLGDKKSFSLRYIDWQRPENNVYHVTEELDVTRHGRNDTYRPDIVLYVNGIPLVVIECKSPRIKAPIDQAIEQHLRNQQEDGIRSLYYYANLVIALSVNQAKYGTTATSKEFWSVWKEQFSSAEAREHYQSTLQLLKNAALPYSERTVLFQERYYSALKFYNELEKEQQVVTEQDKLLFSLCRIEKVLELAGAHVQLKDRLLDLSHNFTLFDDGIKKVARYQQYFAVRQTLERVKQLDEKGRRKGGVIWHTQGSGKSLTMVMLAQLIATDPTIKNPKIVLVTDRVDLDDQIADTFKKCGRPVIQAETGKHLVAILEGNGDAIITTIINKFEAAVNQIDEPLTSPNIFVLVDESHRSQYGTFNVKMQRVFQKGCFVAFTGTPLRKKEKDTARKFGGIIDGAIYTIKEAVEDGAVVPLLYEGRHNQMDVNGKPLDKLFERISRRLTERGKQSLKQKFSTRNALVKSEGFIENTAWDIAEHFDENLKDTGFKAQLVAPNKLSAIRYRDILRQTGLLTAEVLISPPDMREGEEDAFEVADDKVKQFWKAMMDKYGTAEKYEKALIAGFKKHDDPEIIIVVDKLLTGFDAPRNQVLYITRQLKEHTLLQAIARVNRLHPGKDYGYIIDYFGNLGNLDTALEQYSGLEGFEKEDLQGSYVNVLEELKKLPQAHSDLWEVFKEVRNKYDEPAYEELLADEEKRHRFYQGLSLFARLLKLALSSYEFMVATDEKQVEKYKKDAQFFLALRVSVMRRYFDDIDYKEYEPQVQKLIDKHITTDGEVLKITPLVNLFNKEERQAELAKITSAAARADHIASRTLRAISVKMEEDPVYYKKLSEMIKQSIEEFHQQRLSEAEFLARTQAFEEEFFEGKRRNVPDNLRDKAEAIAFYNLATEELKETLGKSTEKQRIAAEVAERIDDIMRANIYEGSLPVVDWQHNLDIEGRIKIDIDDMLFDTKNKYALAIDFEEVDNLIEECLKVAKLKYVNV